MPQLAFAHSFWENYMARVDTAPLEQLEAWSDRITDATTLDDVFA